MPYAKAATAMAVAMSLICIVATSQAGAEITEAHLLPGAKGTIFTGKSGKVTLQIKGGGSVTCSSSTGEGELTSQTTGKGTIDVKGCSVAGLPIQSLGDASGTVLITGETSTCLIEPGKVGIVTHLPKSGVHIEVPSTKLLIVKKGDFITIAEPVEKTTKTFSGKLTQKGGQQAVTKCEGGPEEVLLISLDGGTFTQAGLEMSEGTLTFANEEELMT